MTAPVAVYPFSVSEYGTGDGEYVSAPAYFNAAYVAVTHKGDHITLELYHPVHHVLVSWHTDQGYIHGTYAREGAQHHAVFPVPYEGQHAVPARDDLDFAAFCHQFSHLRNHYVVRYRPGCHMISFLCTASQHTLPASSSGRHSITYDGTFATMLSRQA